MNHLTGEMKKVAVLTGGLSSEREIALRSADEVCKALEGSVSIARYTFPEDRERFLRERESVAVAIPVFHGVGGEDGAIQGFLRTLNIPFLFSDVLSQAVALNKAFTKHIVSRYGIRTAPFRVYRRADISRICFDEPCVIKPLDGGSSVGVSIVKTPADFSTGLRKAFVESESILVERYISGKEYTVAIVETRGEMTALPVIAIQPKTAFFDLQSKYNASLVEEVCPALISSDLRDRLQEAARRVHLCLGAKHLSRSDFMVDEEGNEWFLEINTIPGLTDTSLVPKAVRAAGMDLGSLLSEWIVSHLNH